MNWTLEQLRHFVAAADAGSFSAAARQVGRAQSAVSTSLGLLEADLGVELFDRSRRNATLTRAGEVLLLEARELLRQAAGLEQRALSFAAGQDARLSVALDEALPDRVLAVLVREVSTRFPALELSQLNGTATEVADYVQQGRASVAFHFDRGDPGPAFAHRYLGDVGQGIFVARDHPLA
ncbi:LysR family transcriptional regulator, partial [Achromobacter sp.]